MKKTDLRSDGNLELGFIYGCHLSQRKDEYKHPLETGPMFHEREITQEDVGKRILIPRLYRYSISPLPNDSGGQK